MIEAPQARSRAGSLHRGVRRRHAARLAAVQALYQIEVTGDPANRCYRGIQSTQD